MISFHLLVVIHFCIALQVMRRIAAPCVKEVLKSSFLACLIVDKRSSDYYIGRVDFFFQKVLKFVQAQIYVFAV